MLTNKQAAVRLAQELQAKLHCSRQPVTLLCWPAEEACLIVEGGLIVVRVQRRLHPQLVCLAGRAPAEHAASGVGPAQASLGTAFDCWSCKRDCISRMCMSSTSLSTSGPALQQQAAHAEQHTPAQGEARFAHKVHSGVQHPQGVPLVVPRGGHVPRQLVRAVGDVLVVLQTTESVGSGWCTAAYCWQCMVNKPGSKCWAAPASTWSSPQTGALSCPSESCAQSGPQPCPLQHIMPVTLQVPCSHERPHTRHGQVCCAEQCSWRCSAAVVLAQP